MIRYCDVRNNNDIEKLSYYASLIWHEYYPSILSLNQIDYMIQQFQSVHAIKDQILNGYIYYLILDDDKIIGYFGIDERKDQLFLSKLYILKEFRGKKYAYNAFCFIKDIAKRKNLKSIYLTVNKYNYHAIETYQKFGFRTVKSIVTDIGLSYVMDDYVMEFYL